MSNLISKVNNFIRNFGAQYLKYFKSSGIVGKILLAFVPLILACCVCAVPVIILIPETTPTPPQTQISEKITPEKTITKVDTTSTKERPTATITEISATDTAESVSTDAPFPTRTIRPTPSSTPIPITPWAYDTEDITGLVIAELFDVYLSTDFELVIRNQGDQDVNLQGWRVFIDMPDFVSAGCLIDWDAPVVAGGSFTLTGELDSCGPGFGMFIHKDKTLRLVDPNMNDIHVAEPTD